MASAATNGLPDGINMTYPTVKHFRAAVQAQQAEGGRHVQSWQMKAGGKSCYLVCDKFAAREATCDHEVRVSACTLRLPAGGESHRCRCRCCLTA